VKKVKTIKESVQPIKMLQKQVLEKDKPINKKVIKEKKHTEEDFHPNFKELEEETNTIFEENYKEMHDKIERSNTYNNTNNALTQFGKFYLNVDFFKNLKGAFYDDGKYVNKSLLSKIKSAQHGFDLINTPDTAIDKMLSSINKDLMYNFLEPSAGLGFILSKVIENLKLNRVDALEFNYEIYDIVEKYIKISSFVNSDFLYWIPKHFHDLIIMNPPYKGQIPLKFGNVKYMYDEHEYYIFHLIKAVILPFFSASSSRTILIICPFLNVSEKTNPRFKLIDCLNIQMRKKLKYFFGIDMLNIPDAECEYLGICKDFKTITNSGKISNPKYTMSMYKIIVKPNAKYVIPSIEKYKTFYEEKFKQPEIVFEQYTQQKEKITKIIKYIESIPKDKMTDKVKDQLKEFKQSLMPTY
jgi:hypothetical protein